MRFRHDRNVLLVHERLLLMHRALSYSPNWNYSVAIITSFEVVRLSALCSFPQGDEANSPSMDINVKWSVGLKRVRDSMLLFLQVK